MLNLSAQYAPGLQRFLDLMRTGMPQTEALRQVYGRSTGEVFRDLQDYINGNRFIARLFKAEPLDAIGTIQPKQLTPSESGFALANLLISLGKSGDAQRKLKRLAADHPNIAVLRRRSAALLRESQGDLKQAMHDLQTAIDIDPSYSQARDLLASMEFTFKSLEAHFSPEAPESWQNREGDRRIDGKLVQLRACFTRVTDCKVAHPPLVGFIARPSPGAATGRD